MSMDEMVRDMRNRFIVSLVFTLPILALDPMGLAPPLFEPPFGLGMDITMFILASAAVLYPGWPFFVAAVRAHRNGVLNMAVLVLLSVGTGYLFSVGSTFLFDGEQFYEAVAVLLVSCWGIGWRCAPERGPRRRSVHCSTWRRPRL